jgi:Na+-driven multidrug efflux pump
VIQRLGGGAQTKLSASLILAFTATFVIRAWVDARSTILNASNVLRPQIFFYMGHALLNFVIAIVVVRRFGVEGVAWTTAITGLLTAAWGYPYLIRRYITSRGAIAAPAAMPVAQPDLST